MDAVGFVRLSVFVEGHIRVNPNANELKKGRQKMVADALPVLVIVPRERHFE